MAGLGLLDSVIAKVPTPVLLVLGIFSIPFIAIFLNVLRQLVLPVDPALPPVVFHLIPWFGSAASYGQRPIAWIDECQKKYGNVFSYRLLGRTITVALGPKGNNLILGGRLNQVSAEEAYTHLTTPVFGKGVVYDCPNDMLMQQKRMVKFGLSTENLKAYIPMIREETRHFFEHELKLTPTNPVIKFDALESMADLIILTAARTLQGKEVRASLDHKFAKYFEDLDGGFTPLNFMFPNLPLPSYRRRDKAQRLMSNFYQDIIRKRRAGEADHEPDMIHALMESEYKNGTPLSDSDIAHMMIALLMAGQHTSSATSSWALLNLAERPDVYEDLYREQKEVFGNPDGTFRDLTYDQLKDLPLLDSVIRETLRVRAPLHSIMRKVISDIPVPTSLAAPKHSESASYVIPTGHFVMACPGVAQMDPKTWNNASKWDPYRWSDKEGVASKAHAEYTGGGEQMDYGFGTVSKGTESPYAPFGAGRHRCIGESFAYVQLQTIIATLVRTVTIELEGPMPEPNFQTMVVLPLKGKSKIVAKLRV